MVVNRTGMLAWFVMSILFLLACKDKRTGPALELLSALKLKQGALIACGPPEAAFGKLSFPMTGNSRSQEQFALGLKLLHSFEYDEAEKVFAGLLKEDPTCYMAYWGVAMSNFHPLWSPPLPDELTKGMAAIDIALTFKAPTRREGDYLKAIAAFYTDYKTTDHRTRTLRFEKEMEQLKSTYPDDKEALILYALSLDAAADPADKTYQHQKQAGEILKKLYVDMPDHPGVVHYLIHTYDYPGLAQNALVAARRYASVAPSSAHALHMPSHIFTRLGLWQESVQANLQSIASAQCYAEQAGIKGHWDEELHGIDYVMYAYLQQGDNKHAEEELHYLGTIKEVHPANFKVAYAFAAVPARLVLENKYWQQAAVLDPPVANFVWKDYPWQEAVLHYARALGDVHTGKLPQASLEVDTLDKLYQVLIDQKDLYKATQVRVQWLTAKAWLLSGKGQKDSALKTMEEAAALEDKTEKHPVTPAEILPARELLGDLLLEYKEYAAALMAYENSLHRNAGRFNTLYGAAQAARLSGDMATAKRYYQQLLAGTRNANSNRQELATASQYAALSKTD